MQQPVRAPQAGTHPHTAFGYSATGPVQMDALPDASLQSKGACGGALVHNVARKTLIKTFREEPRNDHSIHSTLVRSSPGMRTLCLTPRVGDVVENALQCA